MDEFLLKPESTLGEETNVTGNSLIRILNTSGASKVITFTNAIYNYISNVLSNYLKSDGTKTMDTGYSPSTDLAVCTKKYTDDEINILNDHFDNLMSSIVYGGVFNSTSVNITVTAYHDLGNTYARNTPYSDVFATPGDAPNGIFKVNSSADIVYKFNVNLKLINTSGSSETITFTFSNMSIPIEIPFTIDNGETRYESFAIISTFTSTTTILQCKTAHGNSVTVREVIISCNNLNVNL